MGFKKINLIATSIEFTKNSIVYNVELESNQILDKKNRFLTCRDDIRDKDLLLKSTFFNEQNKQVIFSPINVTVPFYQKILLDRDSKLSQEYKLEINDIYSVGDIVAVLIVN